MKKCFRRMSVVLACALACLAVYGKAVRAADDAVITADKTLVAAFEKGDKAALNKYLDPDFSWIDTDGVMTSGADALALGMKPKLGEGNDVQVREFKIGDSIIWLHLNSGPLYVGRGVGEALLRVEAAAHHGNHEARPRR